MRTNEDSACAVSEHKDTVFRVAKYRTILYLFYYEEYSTEEIAALLNIPAATVRTRLAAEEKKLRNILEEENIYE